MELCLKVSPRVIAISRRFRGWNLVLINPTYNINDFVVYIKYFMTKIIILLCLAVSSTLFAMDAPTPISTPTLNQTMTEIGQVMVDIFPLIVAKRAFTDA